MSLFDDRGRLRACMSALLLACAAGGAAAECSTVNYRCEASVSAAVEHAGAATFMLRFAGASQCTGTLVNNGRNDGRPFILTARHCAGAVPDEQLDRLAAAVQIVYRRELSCDSANHDAGLVRYGAIHRASFEDIWLIEAIDPVPDEAMAWFAGLDASGSVHGTRFGIHHGNGGYKQFVVQQVESGNLVYIVLDTLGIVAHTWYTRLVMGSTPYGASGSGLFDDAARVCAVLSRGVICSGDVQGNDYQQLAVAWEGGGTSQNSLKFWLDPDARGFRQLDARSTQGASDAQNAAAPAGSNDASDGAGGGSLTPQTVLILLFCVLALRHRATVRECAG